MCDEIIITNNDVLDMLDDIIQKRDCEWWDKFYADRNRPIPFFNNSVDECLIDFFNKGFFNIGEALDIGCGNGRNTKYLSMCGFKAIGIDISSESIKWAKENMSEFNAIDFKNVSLFNFNCDDGSFDLIIDSGCFHHIKPHRREEYLSKIQNALKLDGYFLMTCFTTDGGANISDFDVYREYSMQGGLGFCEEKIKKILSHYFEIVVFRKMNNSTDPNVFGKDFMWVILMKKKGKI